MQESGATGPVARDVVRGAARPVGRRALLMTVGTGALLAVTACADDSDVEITRETGAVPPPDSTAEVLQRAELAPAPDGSGPRFRTSATISEFELWAVEVRFAAPTDVVEDWVLESYGDPDGVGRAWVTPQKVKDAMGIDDVPDTWRIDEVSVQGTAYERMVLIDDADPRTVRVRLSARR
jgi:hypothetical protein